LVIGPLKPPPLAYCPEGQVAVAPEAVEFVGVVKVADASDVAVTF
jgi:hypothetical protein